MRTWRVAIFQDRLSRTRITRGRATFFALWSFCCFFFFFFVFACRTCLTCSSSLKQFVFALLRFPLMELKWWSRALTAVGRKRPPRGNPAAAAGLQDLLEKCAVSEMLCMGGQGLFQTSQLFVLFWRFGDQISTVLFYLLRLIRARVTALFKAIGNFFADRRSLNVGPVSPKIRPSPPFD